MVECMEKNKQTVMPIFYNVDPSYVRHQKGDYGAALAKHKEDLKENMTKAQNWISALQKAAQLSGFHYPSNFESESDLVDEIIKDVSNKLSNMCLGEADDLGESNDLVGIDQNIASIKSLLATETRDVLKLGIWGMGGIGKTTIARVVFDTFSPQYEGCCFLENVRGELENHQLSYLRERLVSELLEKENPLTNGRGKSNFYTKRMLSRMKILIVLDDVNTPNLLKDFLEHIHLGPGSRVIVTGRDKQVFTAGGFHEIHMVKELNFEESLKLFCLNAFNESRPKMGYEELSKRAVAIAKGNPLTLKVFGSHLHSKSIETWECALEKLKKYPDQNIQRVLRLSYDGLDDLEKKIFLDIAFFFKEEDKGYVISQLDAWHFHGTSGIQTLQDKALITILDDTRIQMHDLIQEMGWEVVRQESTDVGRHSRLRDPEEVCDVLKNNKGTDVVEGMLLDVSQMGEVAFNFDSLKSMPNLRFLKICFPLHVELPPQISIVPKGNWNVDLEGIPNDKLEELCLKMVHEVFDECKRWQQPWDALVTDEERCMQLLVIRSLLLANRIFQYLKSIRRCSGTVKGCWFWIHTQLHEMWGILNRLQNDDPNVLCNANIAISKPNFVSGSNQFQDPDIDTTIQSALRDAQGGSLDKRVHSRIAYFVESSTSEKKCLADAKNSLTHFIRQIQSALRELMDLGCEVRMKEMEHVFLDGCPIVGVGGIKTETVPQDKQFHFVRSTNYRNLTSNGGREQQDTSARRRKPKLQVLFDGLGFSERSTYTTLREFVASTIDFEPFLVSMQNEIILRREDLNSLK